MALVEFPCWGEPVNAHAAMGFDPFGARRDADTAYPWSLNWLDDVESATRRGYTGHEHVDTMGVIHMNGRIYAPSLGRFLQADPVIQDLTNSQALNPYSYVLNNPLAYTDPTGYWGQQQQAYVRMAAAIVIAVWSGAGAAGLAADGAFAQAAAVAFVGGYAAGSLQTGSGKGALQSGVSAVVFMGINAHYGKIASSSSGLSTAQVAQRALVSGVAGGVLSMVQGGRFGSGFASAGLGSALNPAISAVGDNTYAQTFMAAIVGGTVSEAAGGKFANGAMTGAFQFAVGRAVQNGVGRASADDGDDIPVDLSTAPSDEIRRQMASSNAEDRLAAAVEAIRTFKIKPLAGTYDLEYNSMLKHRGLTTYRGGIDSLVELGPSAYVTWSQLAATLGHEIEVHVYDNAMFGGYETRRAYYKREENAYKYNLRNVSRFNNSAIERAEMERQLLKYGGGQ